jgi:hypothetical protein
LTVEGTLNVVDPSPEPNVVPIMPKRVLYVVLLTALPLQRSHPEGAEEAPYIRITPDGAAPVIALICV